MLENIDFSFSHKETQNFPHKLKTLYSTGKKAHAGNTCSSTRVSCRNEHLRFLKLYLPGVMSKYCQNTRVRAYFDLNELPSLKHNHKLAWFYKRLPLLTLSTPLSGYFVQDAGDIILAGHARGSWEFLLHHALVRLPLWYLYIHASWNWG